MAQFWRSFFLNHAQNQVILAAVYCLSILLQSLLISPVSLLLPSLALPSVPRGYLVLPRNLSFHGFVLLTLLCPTVFTIMLRTAELDMAKLVNASDTNIFLADAAWAICFTHHTVLKPSPGAVIFGQDMLFDIPFIADWKKIGEHRQRLTDLNTAHENEGKIDYDYKVGQKMLVQNKGILCKAQSMWQKDPWTITTVHTNGTITIQRGNNQER
jgi:hypothetical protein